MIGNGANATVAGGRGEDGGWLYGNGGNGAAGASGQAGGAGGDAGLLGNGGHGGAGGAGANGGNGGNGGQLVGNGGDGGNGGAAVAGNPGLGGTGGKAGLFGQPGSDGQTGATSPPPPPPSPRRHCHHRPVRNDDDRKRLRGPEQRVEQPRRASDHRQRHGVHHYHRKRFGPQPMAPRWDTPRSTLGYHYGTEFAGQSALPEQLQPDSNRDEQHHLHIPNHRRPTTPLTTSG